MPNFLFITRSCFILLRLCKSLSKRCRHDIAREKIPLLIFFDIVYIFFDFCAIY